MYAEPLVIMTAILLARASESSRHRTDRFSEGSEGPLCSMG